MSGLWRKKEARIREAMTRRNPACAPDPTSSIALKFIFPELASKLGD
jgi:hypothetical protein